MLTKNIDFKNFSEKKKDEKVSKFYKELINENNQILKSLKKNYLNSYTKKIITRLKKFHVVTIIGMGGSILGSKAIYTFLKDKIKKKVFF